MNLATSVQSALLRFHGEGETHLPGGNFLTEASVSLDLIHPRQAETGTEPKFGLAVYSMTEAKPEMITAAKKYEKRFRISFASLTHFPKEFLNKLHKLDESRTCRRLEDLIVASKKDESILIDISLLSQIANSINLTTDRRKKYYRALLNVYKKLPAWPDESREDDNILFIGIEREGKILAQSLNWLPRNHSIHPHAKRIPFRGGLLIGLTDLAPLHTRYNGCIIIDGAIASGATIIAMIEQLRSHINNFSVYSVHSSDEGLRAVSRFARSKNITVKVTVGHATAGIDKHFYAIDPAHPEKVVVGDLGDTISNIFDDSQSPAIPSRNRDD